MARRMESFLWKKNAHALIAGCFYQFFQKDLGEVKLALRGEKIKDLYLWLVIGDSADIASTTRVAGIIWRDASVFWIRDADQ